MNVALVFSGLSGGVNSKNGGQSVLGKKCFDNINENLIQPSVVSGHKIDIFYHTWSSNDHDEINRLYNPVSYEVENQKKLAKNNFLEKVKQILLNFYLKRDEKSRKNNIYSKWYSFKKSLTLLEKHKDSYDLIITLRFDMVFKKKININDFNINKINLGAWTALSENGKNIILDEDISKYDISSLKKIERGYPKENEGFHDFFIASNPKLLLNTFKGVYDDLGSLIIKSGLSNHNIILEVLKKHKLLNRINYSLQYIYDYTLYRWL